ncbi:MAG: hypothetical protein HY331_03495 [Chloroflexi bacterium]|nr:hypothetical protein [Chloroflexota bacterium]
MAVRASTPAHRPVSRARWVWLGLAGLVIGGVTVLTISANVASNQMVSPGQAGPVVKPIVARAQAVPVSQSKLTFRMAGTVKRVAVKPGDAVQAGATLVELEAGDVLLNPYLGRARKHNLAVKPSS